MDYCENVKKEIAADQQLILNSAGELTFSEAAFEWLEGKRDEVKESTSARYGYVIRRYFCNSPLDIVLKNIDQSDVESYFKKLKVSGMDGKKPLSGRTIADIKMLLNQIIKYCQRMKYEINFDVTNIPVKVMQPPADVITLEEQVRIIEYLVNNPTRENAAILASLSTGMRVGEICALKKGDIDLDNWIIHVRRTLQRISNYPDEKKKTKLIEDTAKTDASQRQIPIPSFLKDVFQYLCINLNDNDYLLTGNPDKSLEPRTMENKLSRVLCACSISHHKFHSLRHTFATRCVEEDMDIKSLSGILGHSSVNITLNRYVHPSLEYKRKGMEKLAKSVGPIKYKV